MQKDKIWPSRGFRLIWLHLDNCKVHNSMYTQTLIETYRFKRAPHPAYSPDLAPSDFFLFGYIKEKLRGQCFTKREDLLEEIYTKINEIPHPLKRKVFNEWKDRCLWVSKDDGLYFPN